jgi:hypothetical protein
MRDHTKLLAFEMADKLTGGSVSPISNDNTFLIGAYKRTVRPNFAEGAAYVFIQPDKYFTVTAPASASAGTHSITQ